MPELPRRITISEVGPRDGLQIERSILPTAQKLELIEALAASGLSRIEVAGFVRPDVVPQFADAPAIVAGLKRHDGVRYAALVPNARGAARAIAAGIDDLKTGIAASDSFNELNVRMTTEQGMRAIDEIAAAARGTASRIVGVVATAFGCPYEGAVPLDRVRRLAGQLVEHGAPLVYLADTTGMANPRRISEVVTDLQGRWPEARFGLHLHNTRGAGLANALAGLYCGVTDFESSIGGLGGCPFAPRAVGNICTEDFVHMAAEMGIETGIDLDALIRAAQLAQALLGRTLPGMVMKAGKAGDLHEKQAPRVKLD
jgi:hydroxymethylglutaryl-CoA lyase